MRKNEKEFVCVHVWGLSVTSLRNRHEQASTCTLIPNTHSNAFASQELQQQQAERSKASALPAVKQESEVKGGKGGKKADKSEREMDKSESEDGEQSGGSALRALLGDVGMSVDDESEASGSERGEEGGAVSGAAGASHNMSAAGASHSVPAAGASGRTAGVTNASAGTAASAGAGGSNAATGAGTSAGANAQAAGVSGSGFNWSVYEAHMRARVDRMWEELPAGVLFVLCSVCGVCMFVCARKCV